MLRIKELRLNKGLNMKEAARLLKMPYTTYVNYEKGLREPTSEILIQLADFYSTSIDYMVGRTSWKPMQTSEQCNTVLHTTSPELSTPEQSLLTRFRLLSTEGQQKVIEYTSDLCASGRYIKTTSDNSIPKQA